MYPASRKIGLAIIAVALAGGTVIIVKTTGGREAPSPPSAMSAQFTPPPEVVHTTDWYVAHPDVLKADDARCGSDAASIPQAACQNAATADQRLLAAQLQQAAAANAATAKTSTQQAP